MVVQLKCLECDEGIFQRAFTMGHLHLFIGKVFGWFWGVLGEVSAELACELKHGLVLTWGTLKQLAFVAICFAGKFLLVPSMVLK